MLILNSGVMAEVSSVLDELVWEEEDKEKFPTLKLRKIWDSHSGKVKNTILDHLWQSKREWTLKEAATFSLEIFSPGFPALQIIKNVDVGALMDRLLFDI